MCTLSNFTTKRLTEVRTGLTLACCYAAFPSMGLILLNSCSF